MDLEQLDKIDTSNPSQVKELQTFLKTRGYYSGPIDGKWGGGTTDGTVKLRGELTTRATTARDTAVANQEASDPTNNAIRGATEVGPYVGGMAVGATVGHLIGKGLKSQDAAQRAATKSIATNPKITAEAANAQMRGMRSSRNAVTGAQFGAPALFLGSAEYLRRGIAPKFENPDGTDTETSKWMKLGANADQGIGLGTLGHQLVGLRHRIPSPNDQVDEALIRSRPPTPPAPPPDAPPALRTPADRLTAAAKAAGATGAQAKTKAAAVKYLETNVTPEVRAAVAAELGVGPGQKITSAIKKLSTSRKPSVLIGPTIAAGVGYDAASGDAEAAGATPAEAQARGAAVGTGAAAATGGALYGASKLPQVGRVLGPAGNALAAYDYASQAKGFRDAQPPEQRETIAGKLLPHAMPLAMRGAEDIASIARTPGRLRDAAVSAFTPGNATPEDVQGSVYPEAVPPSSQLASYSMGGRAGPLMSASALQIPEGIPMPRQDGASPYAEAQPARAASGDQKFDDALSGFLALIQEHNSSLQGAQ